MTKKLEPGMAFDTNKLNKIFAILSVIFFITVMWVFLDDYIRPWKAIQVEAMKIQRRHAMEEVAKFDKELDKNKLKEVESKLDQANAVIASRKEAIEKIEHELKENKKELVAQTIRNGQLNAQVSSKTFMYEGAHSRGEKGLEKQHEELLKLREEFTLGRDKMKMLQGKEKEILARKAEQTKELDEAEKAHKELMGKKELLTQAIDSLEMSPVFFLRNAPFLDYMDPSIKIKQIVLNNITDDRYFRQIPKVDRCITCHTFIDQPGFEKEKNPFRTHPKLDLLVGAESKHPMKKFGCTTCHGGEGHRVNDFSAPAHMPENAKQEEEWIAKYNWKHPHHIPQPMLKLSQTEASCLKCHQGVEHIPQGTVVNDGRRLIEKYGCYNCHKIAGWEHKRKNGPSLLKISGKVNKEFFKNWVWDPRSFNKHARMPTFFAQSNNSSPEFMKKNIAEVNAIAEFIYAQSKDYAPFAKYSAGNADNGKKLISEVGCLACHGVEGLEDQSKKINSGMAPYLTGTGSKVSPDWLVSWLKKPWHYQEDTIMPSFRLTDGEANDIATYLLSLKNKNFEAMKFAPLDKAVRDDILIGYLSTFDTVEVAKKKLAEMNDQERTMELGKRSVGKYGCYSCHNLEGFDGRAPIGPELTKVGSKPLTQFGFGHQHDVEHSRGGWITAHLQNPRRWDIGVEKPFKDLLLMPNFYMSEKEAKTITVALLGQVSEYVPLDGVKRLNANEAIYAEGMKVAWKYNCVGCHQIDGARGDILKAFEDDLNAGPPRLVEEGHRVQSDWLFSFLANPTPIRPWVKVRMPTFNLSNADKNAIVQMWQVGHKQMMYEDNSSELVWAPGEKEQAKKLFTNLNCTSCHTPGFSSAEALGPDLHKAGRRLRASWIKKWLRDPQKILPGTTMPTFFNEDGTGIDSETFEGKADPQIEALTKYVIELGR